MLENLMEIEFAYELRSGSQSMSVFEHYKRLNANIDVVSPDEQDRKMIEQYMINTHGETHSSYRLSILEVSISYHVFVPCLSLTSLCVLKMFSLVNGKMVKMFECSCLRW